MREESVTFPRRENRSFPNSRSPIAKSLEIKQFDEATAEPTDFIVAKQPNGHSDHPLARQLSGRCRVAAQGRGRDLSDLKIVGVVPTKDNSEHELYGVNDPDKAEVGTAKV